MKAPAPPIMFRKRQDCIVEEILPGEYQPLKKGEGYGEVAWATWRCPRCKDLILVTRWHHAVDIYGKVTPNITCTDGCEFRAAMTLDEWVPEAKGQA